jgi:hypothetical protein
MSGGEKAKRTEGKRQNERRRNFNQLLRRLDKSRFILSGSEGQDPKIKENMSH